MCGEANQIYTSDWRTLSCRITVISSKISLICLFAVWRKKYRILWLILSEILSVRASYHSQKQWDLFSAWEVRRLAKNLWSFMILILKWYLYQLLYSEEQRFFPLLFSICSISSTRPSHRQISFTVTGFMLWTVLIFIFLLFLMITALITTPMLIPRVTILCTWTLCMIYWISVILTLLYKTAAWKTRIRLWSAWLRMLLMIRSS